MANFAIVGVAGYIAPRHLTAIAATGNTVVAAYDPFDSVGRLDASFPNCHFFTDQDGFKAYIDSLKGTPDQIEWLSICTPNHTHAQYIRYGLTHGMNVICEKPVVLHSEEIFDIMELEKSTGHQVYTILQLRLHDSIAQLKKRLEESTEDKIHNIDLTYITSRGNWYYTSWKGDIRKSGGIATNIGVHLFDMIQWLFGPVKENDVRVLEEDRVEGSLRLQSAVVNYFLSINSSYLPDNAVKGEKKTYRTLNIDGDEFEFSKGFTELHTLSYQKILAGEGFRISESINSIRIVEQMRPENWKPIQMVDLKGQYYNLQEEIDSAIRRILNSTGFIGGPAVRTFEEHLSSYMDGCHVISCASGTDALQIALMSLDLNPGDEVIVPAFNYVAAAEAAALLRLKPVFVDVVPETFNMDPESLKSAITTKTRAIIPVHLFGQSCDMEPILALAKQYNLYVVEDNAQAIGAEYTFSDGRREKTGTMGTIGCTSFFPSKNLGCFGDGGAIFCKNPDLAQNIRMIANHGQRQKYHHEVVGCNSRLDAIQAAVLDVKLRYLDDFNDARRKAATYYTSQLKSFDPEGRYYQTPEEAEYSTHVYHQYTLRIKGGKRDSLKQYLEKQGIPSMVYYPLPLQEQHAFSDYCTSSGNLASATALCSEVLSIPMHTELTRRIQDKVVDAIKIFFATTMIDKTAFVHESSFIDENVQLGENSKVWHFCHVQSGAVIGKNCSLGQNVNVGRNVSIGDGTRIQNNVSIYEGVELEDNVFCGPSCVFTNVLTPRANFPVNRRYTKTLVKEGASLGANCTIVCGHTIGRHAMIGAGAVVTGDVKDYALMAGVPARQIGWVCECGERLGDDLRCRCGRSYVFAEETILKKC